MADTFRSYLELMRSLQSNLERLTALEKQKADAVHNSDLTALDDVMNQEQALALAFRGMEQTRETLLAQLGLRDVPLSSLPGRFPPQMQGQAVQAVQALQGQYAAYRQSAREARELLETGIQEIDAIVTGLGGAPASLEGAGYAPSAPPELPQSMKTDFRA